MRNLLGRRVKEGAEMNCPSCGHNVGSAMYLDKKCGKCKYNVMRHAEREALSKLAKDLKSIEVQK
jgi:phage FluMu protein Com